MWMSIHCSPHGNRLCGYVRWRLYVRLSSYPIIILSCRKMIEECHVQFRFFGVCLLVCLACTLLTLSLSLHVTTFPPATPECGLFFRAATCWDCHPESGRPALPTAVCGKTYQIPLPRSNPGNRIFPTKLRLTGCLLCPENGCYVGCDHSLSSQCAVKRCGVASIESSATSLYHRYCPHFMPLLSPTFLAVPVCIMACLSLV